MQEFCLQHPITVVRGIANALKLDLGLFSTKTLQEEFATSPVEVWTQNKQSADENWDPVLMKQVWHCPTSISHCSIGKYAQYQAASFQEGLRDDTDKPCSSAAFREMVANETDPARRKKKFPILKFGANVDLVSEHFFDFLILVHMILKNIEVTLNFYFLYYGPF